MTQAPGPTPPARAAPRRRGLTERALFVGPGLLYLGIFFLVPLAIIVSYAFLERGRLRRPSGRRRRRTITDPAAGGVVDQVADRTVDIGRALRVSHHLEVGVTWVNDHPPPIASEAPHGGVQGSGFGKEMSQEAVLEYSVTRHLMIRHAEPPEHDGFRPA